MGRSGVASCEIGQTTPWGTPCGTPSKSRARDRHPYPWELQPVSGHGTLRNPNGCSIPETPQAMAGVVAPSRCTCPEPEAAPAAGGPSPLSASHPLSGRPDLQASARCRPAQPRVIGDDPGEVV